MDPGAHGRGAVVAAGVGTGTSDASATLSTVLRWSLAAAGVALVVLVGSGIYLVFNYRPSASLAWASIQGTHVDSLSSTMHDVHHIAARSFVLLGLASAILAVVIAVQRRRVAPGAFGIVLLAGVIAASVSGALLLWDQLALRTVTVGVDFKGFTKIVSGNNVRSVIIGSKEMSTGAFTTWFFAHILAIPVVLIVLAVAVIRTTRRRADRDVV